MLAADLLERRKMQFTLWRPNGNQNAPKLVIGTFQAGNPNVVAHRLELPLATSAATPGLWSLAARDTGLADCVYHYWYRVDSTHPSRPAGTTVLVTDPFATTVDWHVLSEIPAGFNAFEDPQPASVIRLANGTLSAVDPAGEIAAFGTIRRPIAFRPTTAW
jgi:pullulanase